MCILATKPICIALPFEFGGTFERLSFPANKFKGHFLNFLQVQQANEELKMSLDQFLLSFILNKIKIPLLRCGICSQKQGQDKYFH